MVKFKPVKIVQRGSSYQLYYYSPRGERRRVSVGKDYRHAQRLSVKFSDLLLEGKDPEYEIEKAKQDNLSQQTTLVDLYPIFMERHGKYQSDSMQMIYHYRFANIQRCAQLAEIPIQGISKRLLLDFMEARMKLDGVSTGTVNREAAVVSSMITKANEWEMIETNPIKGFKLLKESEKRNVKLSQQEAAKLIQLLPKPIDMIVEFLIYSGLRKRNVLDLTVEQITFHDITPTAHVTLRIKGGRTESFPLCKHAVDVVKRALGKRTSGIVFQNPRTGKPYVSIHNTFDKIVRKLGYKVNETKLRVHDLRHVYGTWLYTGGVSIDDIRVLMGHKDRSTTDRYITYNRSGLGKKLELMPKIPVSSEAS